MRASHLIRVAALTALGACSQETRTTENDRDVPAIQNDAANTYPSQAAEGSTATTPGAEGGRSSATTGASGPGPAGDANTQQQQTTTP